MICVSLGNISFKEALQVLSQVEMAELRLDLLNFSLSEIRRIFSSHQNLIATFRSGKEPEEKRKSFLLEAVASGAKYIDLDLSSDRSFLSEIKEAIKRSGGQLILSYHNEKKTPSSFRLRQIINRAFSQGAQIAKVACFCARPIDNSRLLTLLNDSRPIVVCGLGQLGLITRIAAPLCGAPFTYAYWDGYPPTAPGQISYQQLKQFYEWLNYGKNKGELKNITDNLSKRKPRK